MQDKPQLENASFTFSQEGNCNARTGEFERLTIDLDSSLGVDTDGDGFFVLKTDGWSVDGVQDLEELFNRIRTVIKNNDQ